jgi:hypothetical protein
VLWLAPGAPAAADGIQVRQAALISAGDGYVLEADFEVTLTHTLQEALNKGVAHFTPEFAGAPALGTG